QVLMTEQSRRQIDSFNSPGARDVTPNARPTETKLDNPSGQVVVQNFCKECGNRISRPLELAPEIEIKEQSITIVVRGLRGLIDESRLLAAIAEAWRAEQ